MNRFVAGLAEDDRALLAEMLCLAFQDGVHTGIAELEFVSRSPKRLFAAFAGQTQLRRLHAKWGDYADLGALAGMDGLRDLTLGGASSVRSVEPLVSLRRLERLHIEAIRYVRDLSPLGRLGQVTDLEFGGDWIGYGGPRDDAQS
jgi:hypothetical protein